MWIARNPEGSLMLHVEYMTLDFKNNPKGRIQPTHGMYFKLPDHLFPAVTHESGIVEVELKIKEK